MACAVRADLFTELLQYEQVAQRSLVDHVDVVHRSLIVHAPPAIDELEPSLGH